jgi:hypothetical protein
LNSTHLAAEGMRSEILESAGMDVDPDSSSALLASPLETIDRLKTMPLGDTPLEQLLAQLWDRAVDIFSGDWAMPCDLVIRLRDWNYP